MGGIGAYSRAKKKNGKQTPQTAAKPKAFPLVGPQDTYLQKKNRKYPKMKQQETYHMTKPVNPPKNVPPIRAVSPNAVSPRKRAMVSWPMILN